MVVSPRNGPAVYEFLQATLAAARENASQLQTKLDELDARIDELVQRKGESFVALARHYLPELSEPSIEITLADMREQLKDVLTRKQRRQRELNEQVQQLERKRQHLEAQLQEITAQLNEEVTRREQLEATVADRLRQDSEFQGLSRNVVRTEQQLEQNEARIEEIRSAATEKLPAYEGSQLFQYLYQRRYGTPGYRFRGLTKRLDRWVAGLIDYARARKSCDFLRVTPAMMDAEVERRREQFTASMERIEAIEDAVADEVGLTDVLRAGERLGAERERLVADLEKNAQTVEPLEFERSNLEHSRGDFYDDALQRLRSFLEKTEEAVLKRRAERTPQPQDDEIVSEIHWFDEQSASLKTEIATLLKEHKRAEKKIAGMTYVLNRYRRSNFDSERSSFAEEFDIQRHVHQFLNGELTQHDLVRLIRSQQRFQPTWVEKASDKAQAAMQSDGSRVLLHALGTVAGEALRHAVSRGVDRRGSRGNRRRSQQGRPRGGGGFTSGEGF